MMARPAAAIHDGEVAALVGSRAGSSRSSSLRRCVPLLYPPIPPLVDLFGHMGRYRVELDIDQSPWLQQYYNYHWAAIGNLGVDLLVLLLAPLSGSSPR